MLSSKRPNSGKVILPLLVAVAALSQLLCLAQTDPVHADERIAFGTVTKASLYPSYVALSGRFGEFVCGGTLLSSTVVLTAAHCLEGITQVTGGDLKLDSEYTVTGGKTVKIKKIVGHPGYSEKKLINDIAILFLSGSLPYKPAKLATSLPKSGQYVTIVGQGETNKKGAVPAKLEKAQMKVRELDHCDLGKKERGLICLQATKVKGKYNEACEGDSGGPAYSSQGVVVGVTSFGENKKCGLNPWTVYSDVPYFTKWIKQVIASGGKGGKEVEEEGDYDYDEEEGEDGEDYDYEEDEEEEDYDYDYEEEGDYDYDYD